MGNFPPICPPVVVIIGAPSSGKGETRKAIIKSAPPNVRLAHIEMGHVIRERKKVRDGIGMHLEECVNARQLAAHRVSCKLFFETFESCVHGDTDILLNDGFPRSPKQLEYLLDVMGPPQILAVHIKSSLERCLALSADRGRGDDQSEMIKSGYARYLEFEQPVVDIIQNLPDGFVHTIDTNGKGPDWHISNEASSVWWAIQGHFGWGSLKPPSVMAS